MNDLESLVEQFRLVIKESNIDLNTAKALGNILNKIINIKKEK